MSKAKANWEKTLQGRFIKWLKLENNPLDEYLEVSLCEDEAGEEAHDFSSLERQKELAKHRAQPIIEDKIARDIEHWASFKGKEWLNRSYALLSLGIAFMLVLVLFQTVAAMPKRGTALAPAHNEVAKHYIEKGIEETGAVNFVAGMILDYRAFDTLGESTVLFVAACAVLILLRADDDSKERFPHLDSENDDRHYEPKNDKILQGSAKVLSPIVLLLGIYVILNGHLSPGGGFSGGAILGAGLILYLNAFGFQKTSRFFSYKTFLYTSFFSLSFYALAKSYSFYCGANHIPSGIPLGTPGNILSSGLILPLNICVGLVVACTMYVFYTLFRKGGV